MLDTIAHSMLDTIAHELPLLAWDTYASIPHLLDGRWVVNDLKLVLSDAQHLSAGPCLPVACSGINSPERKIGITSNHNNHTKEWSHR